MKVTKIAFRTREQAKAALDHIEIREESGWYIIELPSTEIMSAEVDTEDEKYEPKKIVFENRESAMKVLEELLSVVEHFKRAFVSDFNDLIGQKSTYIDDRWGWTNLIDVKIRQVREGYVIDLPSPEPI